MMSNDYLEVKHPYGKSKQMLISVVRSTSCSGGWLRLVVQVIFGFIIVCSFILISLLTIHSHYQSGSRETNHCTVQNCRVICNDAPFFGEFEREILEATTDTESNCGSIGLRLNNPMFQNCTLPEHWLSAIRVNVNELEIVGGNLKTIRSETFQSQFGGNIRVLVLEDVIITTLAAETFLGLSSLEGLHIKNSEIINVRHNALQAVDDTLQVLNIKAVNRWDPTNITGSSDLRQLRIVDFSNNHFDNILGKNSFSNIKSCKVLFLNSCNIISIGAGAFDALEKIEILHLNNNYLITLPHDIFNKLIPREPRISLHENLWNCTCDSNLRLLLKLGLLIIEPTCFYPIEHRGEKISSFEKYCKGEPSPLMIKENLYVFGTKSFSTINHECTDNSSQGNSSVEICSPLPEFGCLTNIITDPIKPSDEPTIIDLFSTENSWLKPSFSVDSNAFSMVSLVFSGPYDYGLMWYHSTCPREIYCINHLPKLLRVYNEDLSTEYIFCRFFITITGIQRDQCVAYNLAHLKKSNAFFYKSVILIVCIALVCLLSGALCVYGLIHKNPILLKGNKRVVFVKHKTVDALVLPVKTSFRDNLPKDPNKSIISNDIFVIPKNSTYPSEKLSRTNSIRTNDSNDPSYISALQPTEDQLAEWRITRNFEATYAYDSVDSNLSSQTQIFVSKTLPYYSYENTEHIYDTVKL